MKRFPTVFVAVILALLVISPYTATLNAQEKNQLLTEKDKNVALETLKDNIDLVKKKTERTLFNLRHNSGEVIGAGVRWYRDKETMPPRVFNTIKNSPAEKAGIQKDDTLVAVNGKINLSDEDFLKEIKGDGKVGRLVVFDIIRNSKKMQVSVVTAVLRPDKTAEANKLYETIKKEVDSLITKCEAATEAVRRELKTPSVAWDNPVFDAYEKVFSEFWILLKIATKKFPNS